MVVDTDLQYILQLGEATNFFYKRLKITIARNGLSWSTDLRDRQAWMEECLKWGETAVFEETNAEDKYDRMVEMMREWGWTDDVIRRGFENITGRFYSDVYI